MPKHGVQRESPRADSEHRQVDAKIHGGDFILRGLTPGTTLCGVWLAGQKPGGLYRVVVTAKADDAGAKPDLTADTGPSDAGTRQSGGSDTRTDDAGPKRGPTPVGDLNHRG